MIRVSILTCLLLVGCTNSPNAMELKLAPAQETFGLNEPIRLDAKLAATKGSVCIDKGNFIAVEVQHPDWARPARSRDWPKLPRQYVGPVLYPFSTAGCFLDVADLQHRYEIVEPRRPVERSIRLEPQNGGLAVQDLGAESYRDWINLPSPLTPGRYRVRARLVTETIFYFVHPMLWKPYDHPVVGETEIVIK